MSPTQGMALAQRLKCSYLLHMRSCKWLWQPKAGRSLVPLLVAASTGALVPWVIACSNDDEPAPAALDVDSDSGAAGGPGSVSDSGLLLPEAGLDAAPPGPGTSQDAGRDAAAAPPEPDDPDGGRDAGEPSDLCIIPADAEQIVAPEPSAAVCQGRQWETVSKVFYLETLADESFRSVTPDELSIAWLAPEVDGGTERVIHYASRVDIVDPFYPIRTIPSGVYAEEGLSLSPDGLHLVVVLSDRSGFTQYSRNSRDEPFFDEPSDAQFMNHRFPGDLLDFLVADPVFASDGLTFYYSRIPPEVTAPSYGTHTTVFVSTREPDDSWPTATPVAGQAIAAHCDERRRITGISSDELTLFYWDELSNSQRAAFRESVDHPFDTAIDLGDRQGAQPNADCTRLYYSGPTDDSDTDLVSAE